MESEDSSSGEEAASVDVRERACFVVRLPRPPALDYAGCVAFLDIEFEAFGARDGAGRKEYPLREVALVCEARRFRACVEATGATERAALRALFDTLLELLPAGGGALLLVAHNAFACDLRQISERARCLRVAVPLEVRSRVYWIDSYAFMRALRRERNWVPPVLALEPERRRRVLALEGLREGFAAQYPREPLFARPQTHTALEDALLLRRVLDALAAEFGWSALDLMTAFVHTHAAVRTFGNVAPAVRLAVQHPAAPRRGRRPPAPDEHSEGADGEPERGAGHSPERAAADETKEATILSLRGIGPATLALLQTLRPGMRTLRELRDMSDAEFERLRELGVPRHRLATLRRAAERP